MTKPKIYECKPCLQTFKGRKLFDEHVQMHNRLMTATEKAAANAVDSTTAVVEYANRPTPTDATEGDQQCRLF